MQDFLIAVSCAKNSERFMVPRYDLYKKLGRQEPKGIQQTMWNGRSFTKCSGLTEHMLTGSTEIYADPENGYLYSLFPEMSGVAFLFDGTMVLQPQVATLYDLKVFVHAPWPMRVARMVRRFNRRGVFGATKTTMESYVGFLVAEALECADDEIHGQSDSETVKFESFPSSVSNYLDLIYLKWYLTTQNNALGWVKLEELEKAKHGFLTYLQQESDGEILTGFKNELEHLLESKHLLSLPEYEQALLELVNILF